MEMVDTIQAFQGGVSYTVLGQGRGEGGGGGGVEGGSLACILPHPPGMG